MSRDDCLTVDDVREAFEYANGELYWRHDTPNHRSMAGDLAGSVYQNGRRYICLNQKRYLAHRLIWLYHHGEWPQVIDHINGDPLDNRIENLRSGTQRQNLQNVRRPSKNNTTGFLGVSRHRGRFRASIMNRGKWHDLGRYDTPERAHQAYLAAKRQMHEFSTL